ncbi:MAG: hydroxymethylglutaryl-CoA lyase [Chloroflexota bacterium]
MPTHVTIHEVCPRDGFQPEERWIPTETKIAIIDALANTGVPEIQATSFVHPKAIPQLRDAGEVFAGITRRPGVAYDALVPNVRGAERAAEAGVEVWHLMLSASERHNQENGNRKIAETLAGFEAVVELAARHGAECHGGLAVAFGCPYEGEVPVSRLIDIAHAYAGLGITEMSLGDTTGMANPAQVYRTMMTLQDHLPEMSWTLHLHDTRGMALANVVAGMEAGITHYDSAVGGLGGCPYAPGATGNVATEDLVHMLHEMGIETGVDLDAVIEIARRLPGIVGHELESRILRAGKVSDLAA